MSANCSPPWEALPRLLVWIKSISARCLDFMRWNAAIYSGWGAPSLRPCVPSMLAKEEKEHTAEFLLTHPIGRSRIITDKLAAVILQIVLLNVVVLLLSLASIAVIGEEIPWEEILLLHLAYFILQIEIAAICFGISAFIRRGSLGIGLGIAAILYFLNIIANISESAEFLKFVTPFGYAEGSDIITNVSLDAGLLVLGVIYGAAGIAAAYLKYCRKDIESF